MHQLLLHSNPLLSLQKVCLSLLPSCVEFLLTLSFVLFVLSARPCVCLSSRETRAVYINVQQKRT
jgi:hypothetical protein